MHPTFVYLELYVPLALRFLVDNDHHLVASVFDEVLESSVAQRYNFCGGFFAKPHTIVVTSHCCLV